MPGRPAIARGHILDDYRVDGCSIGGIDDAGRLALACNLARTEPLPGEPNVIKAIVLADGGTDFPPPQAPPPQVTWVG